MDFGTNKLLVTGASGWLGLGLVNALANGLPDVETLRKPESDLKIRALVMEDQDEPAVKKISDKIEIVTGDICDLQDCVRKQLTARRQSPWHKSLRHSLTFTS